MNRNGAESIAEGLVALLALPEQFARIEAQLARIEAALRPRAAQEPVADADEQLLTVEQAAELANVTAATVRVWITSGRLAGSKPPGSRRWRLRRADVVAYLRGGASGAIDVAREAARILAPPRH